ncbi:cytochrome c biogenesis protein CcsA [Candidatus Symbiothrix dinenymphae]|uniref:cytochrome c biogenesis protein CcsA n=1 Tax=Candidatus Symbiothrix dinenymphae TaxID=467085 RepID=UPI0006C3C2EE|nr:cytochrome c biogenesis protein CcsA [Candidatus Symbiothrix dinenymphae]GAP72995.1 cytochrome c biogenesis protein [Candidatus Symbiothrix dinenymphae]
MEKSMIYSYKTAIVLLVVYALSLAIATFIEKYWGTELAKILVYYSPVFILLQLFLIVNFILSSLKHRLFRKGKVGFVVIHGALIVILAGALTTHLFGKEGMIHLREGEPVNTMLVRTNKGDTKHQLPFQLNLLKFTLSRYPGSASPSGFESHVQIQNGEETFERKISMNHVLDLKGYRLFQASYDKDEKGTILSVNRDVAGRTVTYTGYALLALGFILCFIGKETRFRRLIRELKQLQETSKSLLTGLLLLLLPCTLQAQAHKVDAAHAAAFGQLPLQSIDGRLEPVNTFASEALRKLHHAEKFDNLNPDQFLLSLLAFPEKWMHVPLITYKNKEIAVSYNLTPKQCAYIEAFDKHGRYKLQDDLEQVFAKPPSERSKFDKDLIKLDEQINIFFQLTNGRMLNLFPQAGDKDHKWHTSNTDSTESLLDLYIENVRKTVNTGDNNWTAANEMLASIRDFQETNSTLHIDNTKLQTELLYNQLNIFRSCKKLYLIFGGILLLLSFISLFKRKRWLAGSIRLLFVVILCGLLYHLSGIGLRWYIAGYAPFSNAYETMVYVACITVFAGLLFARRSAITFALATLFGGIILFVSGLNWMDPQISPLVPVLKSPWLMLHVAIIVGAYGFFGLCFLLGLTNLVLISINRKGKNLLLTARVQELTIINELALWAGLALMTIGTFLGAIWANESWGRYWGWDPKETWALITVLVYAVVVHLRLVEKWNNPRIFNWLTVIAFACVLMTYFGVNYYLAGMHSYGG